MGTNEFWGTMGNFDVYEQTTILNLFFMKGSCIVKKDWKLDNIWMNLTSTGLSRISLARDTLVNSI